MGYKANCDCIGMPLGEGVWCVVEIKVLAAWGGGVLLRETDWNAAATSCMAPRSGVAMGVVTPSKMSGCELKPSSLRKESLR